mmetsp:Transcript_96778/g.289049  ORF Transcript_96778/g.289049 Transcript_96778/m.289049 type:complete len:471 (-) Transcript_96778:28-1440(-)
MAFLGFTSTELRTYLIMGLCWIEIVQVNLMEQPYARSLVVCDVPTNTTPGALFSGSKYCGDRLHVINVGAEISGMGQSLENVGRITITLFVSAYADNGRRPAAILGQFMLFASTLLFAIAGFFTSLAMPIFIVAQWLQGMSGIGILDQIITGDVALTSGDSVGVYNRKNMYIAVLCVVLFPMVLYVQYAEILEFTRVWILVNMLNLAALLLLLFFFPETLPEEKRGKESNVFKMVVKELQTFRDLVTTNTLVRWRLVEIFLIGLSDPAAIAMPFFMANFALPQFYALLYSMGPGLALAPFFIPLAPYLHKRFGYRNGWQICYWGQRVFTTPFVIGLPGVLHPMLKSYWGIPGPVVSGLLAMPFCGFFSIVSAVELRIVGQENNAKYQAMVQLVGFFTGALSSAAYSWLFDAEATTPIMKVLPYYFAAFGGLLQIPVWYFKLRPIQLAECDKLTEEMEKEAEKTEEEKKTD